MKCIDKKYSTILLFAVLFVLLLSGCGSSKLSEVMDNKYNNNVYTAASISDTLCVSKEDRSLDGFSDDSRVQSAGLFDLKNESVLYAYNMHDKIYPASITKIMTALLVLEHGDLNDEVTISSTADASNLSIYAQACGLEEGDTWKLGDLLNALLIYSGNDVALAVAEHIGGSVDGFVNMMNRRAHELSAVNTHFMNPHGLHDDMHYTTAYDLYLIFNECIKDERFVEIIKKSSCDLIVRKADGSTEDVTFNATNLYARGSARKPENVTIIGGKTGTTDDYKRCLILLSNNSSDNPIISVIIGADDKTVLYDDMTALIEAIK